MIENELNEEKKLDVMSAITKMIETSPILCGGIIMHIQFARMMGFGIDPKYLKLKTGNKTIKLRVTPHRNRAQRRSVL